MLKGILRLSIIAALSMNSWAMEDMLHLEKGWNLKGAKRDFDVAALATPGIVSIWTYDTTHNSWKAYFPHNSKLMEQLPPIGINPLNKIKNGEGFWVYTTMPQDFFWNHLGVVSNFDMDIKSLAVCNDENIKKPVDSIKDIELSEIANKKFHVLEGGEIEFDKNGEGELTLPDDIEDSGYKDYVKNVDIQFWKGNILGLRNGKVIEIDKKLWSDKNGIVLIAFGVMDNQSTNNDSYGNEFFENSNGNSCIAWSYIGALIKGNWEPIDMKTVLPYKVFLANDYHNGYTIFNENLNAQDYAKDENCYTPVQNYPFSLKNGKIVMTQEFDENNYKERVEDLLQIVKKIGRYDILRVEENVARIYPAPQLKGKNWNSLIDSNISIEGYFLKSNNKAFNPDIYPDFLHKNDISYNIKGDKITFVVRSCSIFDTTDCDEYNESFRVDFTKGNIIKEKSYTHYEVASSAPIWQWQMGEENTCSTSSSGSGGYGSGSDEFGNPTEGNTSSESCENIDPLTGECENSSSSQEYPSGEESSLDEACYQYFIDYVEAGEYNATMEEECQEIKDEMCQAYMEALEAGEEGDPQMDAICGYMPEEETTEENYRLNTKSSYSFFKALHSKKRR